MKKFKIILFIIFTAVFIVSAYYVSDFYMQKRKQTNHYNSLIEKKLTGEPVTDTDEIGKKILPEYAQLYTENNDLVGWLIIEDTVINYPVMQSPAEPDFYLKHLFDKTYSTHGCPYADSRCDINKPSDNIIVYGHHMRDGTMFAQLEKYKNYDFWQEHKFITFDTLFEKQKYEVIAAFKTVAYTNDPTIFEYHEFINAENEEAFNNYITRAKEMSLYNTEVTAKYGDKLLTLSTCEYSNQNGRFVLVAKKVGSLKSEAYRLQ